MSVLKKLLPALLSICLAACSGAGAMAEESPIVTSVGFSGNTLYPPEEIAAYFSNLIGKPADIHALGEDISKLEKFYRSKGFTLAQVVDVKDTAEGTIDLVINEGRIDKIVISGNRRINEFIIRNNIKLQPGAIYNEFQLQKAGQSPIFQNGCFGCMGFSDNTYRRKGLSVTSNADLARLYGTATTKKKFFPTTLHEGEPISLSTGRLGIRERDKYGVKGYLYESESFGSFSLIDYPVLHRVPGQHVKIVGNPKTDKWLRIEGASNLPLFCSDFFRQQAKVKIFGFRTRSSNFYTRSPFGGDFPKRAIGLHNEITASEYPGMPMGPIQCYPKNEFKPIRPGERLSGI